MASAQLLLRGLDGRTRVLRFPGREAVPVADVLAAASAACALPLGSFRLATGARALSARGTLPCDAHGALPSCTVLLSLLGGKARTSAFGVFAAARRALCRSAARAYRSAVACTRG